MWQCSSRRHCLLNHSLFREASQTSCPPVALSLTFAESCIQNLSKKHRPNYAYHLQSNPSEKRSRATILQRFGEATESKGLLKGYVTRPSIVKWESGCKGKGRKETLTTGAVPFCEAPAPSQCRCLLTCYLFGDLNHSQYGSNLAPVPHSARN